MFKNFRAKRKYKKAIKKEQRRQIKNAPSAYDDAIISWYAPEYLKYHRGRIWKVTAILLLTTATGLGLYFDAWTFSLAIAAFAVVYCLVHREDPKAIEIKISNMGIKVGRKKYPYNRIKGFWLMYEPPYVTTLNIMVPGELGVEIAIQLQDQDPAEIREILINKIPEFEGKKEAFTDTLARLLRF